jgi:hypothetical protein
VTVFTALLPILAAAAPAAAPPAPPYPGAALLASFRDGCSDLSSIEAAETAAQKAGWELFEPAKDSQLAQLLGFGMGTAKTMSDDDTTFKTQVRTLHKTIEGHQAEMMLTGVTSYGTHSLGCRVVDFAAPAPLDDAVIADFAKTTAPDAPQPQPINAPGVLIAVFWEPGLFPGHHKTQIGFVPQDSEMKAALHLSGINLMTQLRN